MHQQPTRGSVVSSPSRVWGGAPAAIAFSACFRPQNASGRKKNTILLPLVHVLENQIPALSRTLKILESVSEAP